MLMHAFSSKGGGGGGGGGAGPPWLRPGGPKIFKGGSKLYDT